MIGIMDMPAIAPAAATAIRIGVPGISTPSTATASMIAAANAISDRKHRILCRQIGRAVDQRPHYDGSFAAANDHR